MTIEREPERWDVETDVVIVGGGGCGLTAALAAAEGGVTAVVLEKEVRPLPNTARSAGMIPAAGTRFQRAAGIEETPEDLAADILKKNHGQSDPELTRHLARTAVTLVEWLVDTVGVALEFIDDFKYPGHHEFRMHAPASRTGAALLDDLRAAAERHPGVELLSSSPVVALVADADDAVLGVVIEQGGRREWVRAGRVVLACNGFAGNPEMVARYCPDVADALYFGGSGNTGEGILWGRALGGEVAFMDAYQAHASVAVPHAILITYALIMEGGFQVNAAAERFADESRGYSEHALDVLAQPGGVAWDIYDARLHRLGREFDDYRQALEAGAIHEAPTIEALAARLGLPAAALAATLADYHEVARGRPDRFGRTGARELEPPYFGVRVTGALFHTQGGLRVDRDARVLRRDGRPVPNLYAGGGVAAGISGHGPGGYLSGNGLLTALGYGWLAGRHAARTLQTARATGRS